MVETEAFDRHQQRPEYNDVVLSPSPLSAWLCGLFSENANRRRPRAGRRYPHLQINKSVTMESIVNEQCTIVLPYCTYVALNCSDCCRQLMDKEIGSKCQAHTCEWMNEWIYRLGMLICYDRVQHCPPHAMEYTMARDIEVLVDCNNSKSFTQYCLITGSAWTQFRSGMDRNNVCTGASACPYIAAGETPRYGFWRHRDIERERDHTEPATVSSYWPWSPIQTSDIWLHHGLTHLSVSLVSLIYIRTQFVCIPGTASLPDV